MAVERRADDLYPEPLTARRAAGGLWRVVLLAGFFIAVAAGPSWLGDRFPGDLVLVFLGVLAVVGVFCLFAFAAGLFRFVGTEEKRTLARAMVDSLPQGLVITDREGKIVYANAHYGSLPG